MYIQTEGLSCFLLAKDISPSSCPAANQTAPHTCVHPHNNHASVPGDLGHGVNFKDKWYKYHREMAELCSRHLFKAAVQGAPSEAPQECLGRLDAREQDVPLHLAHGLAPRQHVCGSHHRPSTRAKCPSTRSHAASLRLLAETKTSMLLASVKVIKESCSRVSFNAGARQQCSPSSVVFPEPDGPISADISPAHWRSWNQNFIMDRADWITPSIVEITWQCVLQLGHAARRPASRQLAV